MIDQPLQKDKVAEEGSGNRRRLIPFSVKANRVLLSAALAVLLLLGGWMAWSQAGLAEGPKEPATLKGSVSLSIETPTPSSGEAAEPAQPQAVVEEPDSGGAVLDAELEEAAAPGETPEAQGEDAPETAQQEDQGEGDGATTATHTATSVISRTRQVAMKSLPTMEPEEAGMFLGGASPEGGAAEAQSGSLPSTGISLWLPIQGVGVMALLLFWRELRWHRTGR